MVLKVYGLVLQSVDLKIVKSKVLELFLAPRPDGANELYVLWQLSSASPYGAQTLAKPSCAA